MLVMRLRAANFRELTSSLALEARGVSTNPTKKGAMPEALH
jgi:hypothetical protein